MATGESTQEAGFEPLDLDSAAERLEGLLSEESEDSEDAQTPQGTERKAADPQPEDETETEQSPSEDESEAEEGQDEEPEQQPQTRRLKLGTGEEVEVTLDELEKGYLRQSDYTRKTQEIAEQRKKLEVEELPAVRGQREDYANRITQLIEAIESQTPKEPDWAKFRQEHPDQFADAYASWSAHKEQMNALKQEQQRAVDQVVNDRRSQFSKELETQRTKLLEVLPEWKDQTVARKERAEIADFAKNHGFSDDELGAVTDHRVVRLLRMAMLHERAEKNKPAVRQKIERVKTAAPGAPSTTRKPATDYTRARQRLGQTGRIDHAAEAILLLED